MTDAEISEIFKKFSVVRVIDEFKNQARGLACLIPCHVKEFNDVRTFEEVLQHLNLPQDPQMPHWLQDLDAYFALIGGVDSLKDL